MNADFIVYILLSSPVHLVFGYQPAPARNPIADVQQFVTEFETEFGPAHPPLLTCSYSQVGPQGAMFIPSGAMFIPTGGHVYTLRGPCLYPQGACLYPQGAMFIPSGGHVYTLRGPCLYPQGAMFVLSRLGPKTHHHYCPS